MDWMHDVNWTLVFAPVLGLVGALMGSLVGPLLTARRTKALWLLQQRADLYTDLSRFTLDIDALVGHVTGRRLLDLAAFDASLEAVKRIYPRLQVLASDPVMKESDDLMAAYLALSAEGGAGASPRREVAVDDPLVTAVKDAMHSVRIACRKAMVPRGPLGLGGG